MERTDPEKPQAIPQRHPTSKPASESLDGPPAPPRGNTVELPTPRGPEQIGLLRTCMKDLVRKGMPETAKAGLAAVNRLAAERGESLDALMLAHDDLRMLNERRDYTRTEVKVQDAIAKQDLLGLCRIHNHEDQNVSPCCRVPGRCSHHATFGRERLQRLGIEVETPHSEAAQEQVARHWQAHGTQTNKCKL